MGTVRFSSSFPQGVSGLPEPEPAALAHSRQLAERIAGAIEAAGGWLSFERYMEMALYEPGLGYYSNAGRVFGHGGDFVTAPEMTPLFGATLARQVDVWLRLLDEAAGAGPGRAVAARQAPAVLEVGAGSGMLAAQLLNALGLRGHDGLSYQILELSAERRQQQRQTLSNLAPGMLQQVRWLERLPEDFRGVVIGNEVLDAIPVRIFEWHASQGAAAGNGSGQVFEMGVGLGVQGFEWAARPADPALVHAVDGLLPDDDRRWPSPYRSEVCPAQQGWLGSMAEAMACGVILLMDYGFPAREYYHPQRSRGTLMCHYRHRSHIDPFLWPGLSDITAHVDYSALVRMACARGLTPLGFLSQAGFLLNAGLLDELAALPREPDSFWFAQAQAVQMLLSEAEMGELFKVIAFAKQLDAAGTASLGFSSGNRLASVL